jgi:tetratricopeptide (TPR) repeat protein
MSARTRGPAPTLAAPRQDFTPRPQHDRRRRVRRALFVLGLLPLSLALLLVLKVAIMLHLNSRGRDDYGAGRYTGAAAAFESTLFVNVLESWVAPYDLGTARYRQGEFASARAQLEDALALAPAAEECRVRINLALADEALGDAAVADGDVSTARADWAAGHAVLTQGGCLVEGDDASDSSSGTGAGDPAKTSPDTDGEASAGSGPGTLLAQLMAAVAVDHRLTDKLATSHDPDPADPATTPPDSATQSLEERNDRAEQLRRRAEQKHDDRQHPDSSHPTSGAPPHYEW